MIFESLTVLLMWYGLDGGIRLDRRWLARCMMIMITF